MDYATDRLIQTTIRTTDALKHATIITVAHRILTIADSDVVVVLESGGKIGEMGAPWELLQRTDSLFYGLAKQSNELEEILRIANAAGADASSTPINTPTIFLSPNSMSDATVVAVSTPVVLSTSSWSNTTSEPGLGSSQTVVAAVSEQSTPTESNLVYPPSVPPSVKTSTIKTIVNESENHTTETIAPPNTSITFPPVCDGIDEDLCGMIESNHPVLFEIFLFYSFHSGYCSQAINQPCYAILH